MSDELFCPSCQKWGDHIQGTRECPNRIPKSNPNVKWGEMLRFKTDDDDSSELELCIQQGGNGDWYVSIADGPDHYPLKGVRIRTSGGASQTHPGLGVAISQAYRAMYEAQV